MTSLAAINAALVSLLTEAFPDVPVIAEEISEPIVRPSHKVLFGEITTSADSVNYWTRKIPVEIVYFAKNTDNPKPECNQQAHNLIALLLGAELAAIGEDGERVYFPIGEVKSGVSLARSDALLYLHFDLDEIGAPDVFAPYGDVPATDEPMENLNMNLEVQ